MTFNKLASAIAKAEGKKHQASIGDIREILRIIIRMQAITPADGRFWSTGPIHFMLMEAGRLAEKLDEKKLRKAKKK